MRSKGSSRETTVHSPDELLDLVRPFQCLLLLLYQLSEVIPTPSFIRRYSARPLSLWRSRSFAAAFLASKELVPARPCSGSSQTLLYILGEKF